MSKKKKNIRTKAVQNNQAKIISFDGGVIDRIKELQSIPEEVVIEFLKSQGSISRLSNGEES